jgi:hypothetical protein
VDDEASNLWRRGQNIQGAMPKNILGTARMVSSALKWVYFAKRVLKKFHVEQNISLPLEGKVAFPKEMTDEVLTLPYKKQLNIKRSTTQGRPYVVSIKPSALWQRTVLTAPY